MVLTGVKGDGYGIGIQHGMYAMRRNIDLTYMVMHNQHLRPDYWPSRTDRRMGQVDQIDL
jgi:hypothetical protein